MSTKYSLTVTNESRNYGNICVFQTLPSQPSNILSLAWFSKAAHPNTLIDFQWDTQYNFVWSNEGEIKPGVTFSASQVVNADPQDITQNSIEFVKDSGAYYFVKTKRSIKKGSLHIYTDHTIPHGEAAIGIGMSGNGTFVVKSTPNYNFSFTPHPKYWIAFGDYKVGEVIDLASMSNTAQIKFDPDVYNKKITLKSDNTWHMK